MSGARRACGCLLIAGVLGGALPMPAYAQPSSGAPSSGETEPCLPAPQSVDTSVPWAQRQLAPERAWTLTKGDGITVAVVDTGVDGAIPQLRGAVLPGVDTTRPGREPADNDCFGHGTFVAGIIAAQPVDGTGYVGVAPGVRILPVRCASTDTPNQPGALTPEGMALGIRTAVDDGAQVINVSASTTEQNPALADAIAYAEQRDVVVVASAANSANKGDPVTYPAAFPTVIAVGAVNEAGQHAEFSQTGPFVALVAPGVDVLGLGPGGPGHWKGSGTSYSAPFVAGVAALVRAYRPGLSAAQVKHRLEATATHPAAALPDAALGWGMVNPMAALSTVLPEERGAEAKVMAPPDAVAAPIAEQDEMGPVLAMAGMIGAVVLALSLLMLTRVFSAGRKRGFRPARIIEVTSPEK
jgi:type VII secretion-associated serine protease mycosin